MINIRHEITTGLSNMVFDLTSFDEEKEKLVQEDIIMKVDEVIGDELFYLVYNNLHYKVFPILKKNKSCITGGLI